MISGSKKPLKKMGDKPPLVKVPIYSAKIEDYNGLPVYEDIYEKWTKKN